MPRLAPLLALAGIVLTACATEQSATPPAPVPSVATASVPPAPTAPNGPNDAATAAFDDLVATIPTGLLGTAEIDAVADTGDARHAWLLADLLRFAVPGPESEALLEGFERLADVDLRELADDRNPWNVATNLLLAWDTPAPPEYQRLKGGLFSLVEPGWAPFFADPGATLDWRWVSWGGVFIDDRELGDAGRCGGRGCIPALDDPALVPAADGDWYDDDAIVFGITEGGEAVALPRNIMEVHEMVNMTIGGRRFGIPYCTLCGSAQAYYTDAVPEGVETPVLRTSGLLSRSNKVMYDLVTSSAFDTFTGAAVSGPLREAGVVLEQTSVRVTTWGEWKAEYPQTTIIAEDGGIGRSYPDDPLDGRDDNGPIFPIGDVDPRLAVQERVIGIVRDDGTTVAFPVVLVRSTIASGDPVELDGVTIVEDGGGFLGEDDGAAVATHEAFWFAWSQFHPDTLLWPNDTGGQGT